MSPYWPPQLAPPSRLHINRESLSGSRGVDLPQPSEVCLLTVRPCLRLDVALSRGPANESELLDRCRKLIPQERNVAQIVFALVASPLEEILRPAEIEKADLADSLMQSALFGKYRVLNPAKGTTTSVSGHTLRISQDEASITLSESGDISVAQSPLTAIGRDGTHGSLVEDLLTKLATSLSFASLTLDTVDRRGRISDVCLGAALLNCDYVPWFKPRRSSTQTPGAWALGGTEVSSIYLRPLGSVRCSARLLEIGPRTW